MSDSFLYEGRQVPLWTEKQLDNLSRANLKQRALQKEHSLTSQLLNI